MKVIHKTRLIAVNKKKLLVLEKIGEKKKFTLPGGVKKKKETLVESLVRETAEEIGLVVNPEHTIYLSTNTPKKKFPVTKHHFLLPIKTNDFNVLETMKFKDVFWIHWKKALDYLDKEDRKAVKSHFKAIQEKSKTFLF